MKKLHANCPFCHAGHVNQFDGTQRIYDCKTVGDRETGKYHRACGKRIIAKWMSLSQEEVDALVEVDWKHYQSGGCLCHANSMNECACGAWWKIN